MRSSGVRGLLIYCADYRCSHYIAVTADRWGDDVRLSDIERGLSAHLAASEAPDIRPDFPPAKMGSG
jgi:hypothetical protein